MARYTEKIKDTNVLDASHANLVDGKLIGPAVDKLARYKDLEGAPKIPCRYMKDGGCEACEFEDTEQCEQIRRKLEEKRRRLEEERLKLWEPDELEGRKYRIYISGPISGNIGYEKTFYEAAAELVRHGHDVVNPVEVADALPQLNYEEQMRVDMFLLGMCDAVYMLSGWQQSPGANREYGYALAKDMVIVEE